MAIIRINELPSGSGNLTPDDLIVFMNDPSGLKNTQKLTIEELTSIIGVDSVAAAVDWTTNHTTLDGTRYLVNDLVYSSGNLYRAKFENESIPVTDEIYWENVGPGYRLNIDGRDIPNIPYPVEDIAAGTGISISSVDGIYTITSTGSGGLADQASSIVTTVFNETGSPIPKMTVIYIDGGHGDRPTVDLAIASGDPTSAGTYGITFEQINNMETGKVIVFGALTGVNTDPAHGGIPGATEGSVVYLSPTTPGGLTTTKPSAPYHMVVIGTIVRVHQNEGVIEVRIQNGYELEELHNVAISGVTNGQFLQYNSATKLWVPSSSGNFTTLQVSGTNVSVSGHTHTISNITDFPTIANSGDNRILTSTGTSTGINAESNLTFNGTSLVLTGDASVDNLKLDGNTLSSTNSNGNIVLAPNGSGDVQIDADSLRVGDTNVDAVITTNGTGNLTLNTNAGTNSGSITIEDGVDGNIVLVPNGSGKVGIANSAPSYTLDVTGGGKFTQLYPTVVSNGSVSGSVGTDVSTGQIFDVTLTGNIILSNPTNAADGVTVRWRITQDGTGGHFVSLDTEFQIPSSASSPLPWSTAANATDILAATYHATRAKWDVVAFVPGY